MIGAADAERVSVRVSVRSSFGMPVCLSGPSVNSSIVRPLDTCVLFQWDDEWWSVVRSADSIHKSGDCDWVIGWLGCWVVGG